MPLLFSDDEAMWRAEGRLPGEEGLRSKVRALWTSLERTFKEISSNPRILDRKTEAQRGQCLVRAHSSLKLAFLTPASVPIPLVILDVINIQQKLVLHPGLHPFQDPDLSLLWSNIVHSN